jgi:esterase/lipase
LELIKSLKEKIEIMEHTITTQNNDLEILKKSLKEKDFNSNDFKILNEENELLIDKIKRLEENERNQTLKYQKSIADFNNKINSLKNDYNRAVENFERL